VREGVPPCSLARTARVFHILPGKVTAQLSLDHHADLVSLLHQSAMLHLPLQDPAQASSDKREQGKAEKGETQKQAAACQLPADHHRSRLLSTYRTPVPVLEGWP